MGFLLPHIVQKMPWTSDFEVDHSAKTVTIPYNAGLSESEILETLLAEAREKKIFHILSGWRDELYPVLGIDRVITMERSGSALFGIHTIGVHMNAYQIQADGTLKIWIPRRAETKSTYGGMLDNTVAGGIAAGEDPFECMIREAAEEASLPESLMRQKAKAVGTISYLHVRDERAGGKESETGLMQPETQYLWDLEVGEDVIPAPADGEVQEFYLMSVPEVKKALSEGQFKPNCALCLVDFLVRHGETTASTEKDYLEIVMRMHRRIDFARP